MIMQMFRFSHKYQNTYTEQIEHIHCTITKVFHYQQFFQQMWANLHFLVDLVRFNGGILYGKLNFLYCDWYCVFNYFPVSQYLLIQIQQWKHHNKLWNLFRVTKIDNEIILVSLLLTLSRFHTLFSRFFCWLWASWCRLGLVFFILLFF